MPEGILTAAEIAEIERLDKARTQGEWEWYGYQTGNDIRLQSKAKWRPIVMDFVRWGMRGAAPRFRDAARDVMGRFRPVLSNPDNPKSQIRAIYHPDADFIPACSTAVPRMLATIKALKGLLAEATDWGHTQNCWKTPCTCGYDSWLKKVEKILEGEHV